MYNFSLISSQNLSYYNLIWNTLTYISYFNSSVSFEHYSDWYYYTDINKYYQVDYSQYVSECPKNTFIINCKCSCNDQMIGIDIDLSYKCKCKTRYGLTCQIEVICAQPTSSFNTSLVNQLTKLLSSKTHLSSTCNNKYNQLMTSCHFYLYTGAINQTKNSTISGQLRETNYIYTADFIAQNCEGSITNHYSTSPLNSTHNQTQFWQECLIPPDIQGSIKSLSVLRNQKYYGQIVYNCISIKCEPFPKTNCTDVTYSNLALNSDIIWGTLAYFSCKHPSCFTENKTLECKLSGFWNDTAPVENCFDPKITTSIITDKLTTADNIILEKEELTTVKIFIGNWSNWTVYSCVMSLNFTDSLRTLTLNVSVNIYDCMKLDLAVKDISLSAQTQISEINKGKSLTLQMLDKEYRIRRYIGIGCGMIVAIVLAIFIFSIFFGFFLLFKFPSWEEFLYKKII